MKCLKMNLFNFLNTQQTLFLVFYFALIGSSLVSAKYNKEGKRKKYFFVYFIVRFYVLRTD
jgi:hypothetical protein